MPMRTQDIQNETKLKSTWSSTNCTPSHAGQQALSKIGKVHQGSQSTATDDNTPTTPTRPMGLKITSVNGLPINQISHWHSHRGHFETTRRGKDGQSMTSLRPQQARSPSCLAVIHRRCSALAPKTRNNRSCCSVCTRPTVHGLIATELLPDSSNLCNPGWTRRCSAHVAAHTIFQDMQHSEQSEDR